MKSFIVKRSWPDFDRMVEIYQWCEIAFGKTDYIRWTVNFANGTQDFVEFDFKKDEDASAFVLQWGDYCVSKQLQRQLGLISWDQV